MGDERPSPTYLDDAAPAGQAARFALPGEGAGCRAGGRSERRAMRSPGGAGPGFVPGHAEAAVSVGNPAAVIARPPVSDATSPAAAALPSSGFQGSLGAEDGARGGGQGPAGGAPPAALRHGRPATRQHKAASPRPRVPAAASGRRARPLLLASSRAAASAASSAFFFFFFFNLDVMFVWSWPSARLKSRRQNYRKMSAGERRKRHKSAPAAAPSPGTWGRKTRPGTRAAAGAKNTPRWRGAPGPRAPGAPGTHPEVTGRPAPGDPLRGRSTHPAGPRGPAPEPGHPPRAQSEGKPGPAAPDGRQQTRVSPDPNCPEAVARRPCHVPPGSR